MRLVHIIRTKQEEVQIFPQQNQILFIQRTFSSFILNETNLIHAEDDVENYNFSTRKIVSITQVSTVTSYMPGNVEHIYTHLIQLTPNTTKYTMRIFWCVTFFERENGEFNFSFIREINKKKVR